jgi:Helix-turn-helix domain
MSVKVMSLVFDRYPRGGGERLLALALADHAHDDGTRIFPSVSTLSRKSFQSERTVQRQLRKMEQDGWLIRVSDFGSGRGNCTEYCINPDWLKGDNLSPFMNGEKGDIPDIKGDIAVSQKGDIAVSPDSPLTIKEPSDARAIPREASIPEKPNVQPIVWDSANKNFTNISEQQMITWEQAFPKLDIDGELTRIELWYANNPKKRKRNLQRFIANWLARAFKDSRTPKVFVTKQPPPVRPP